MRIVFLMLDLPDELSNSNLYLDLALEFKLRGHDVYIIAPSLSSNKDELIIERGVNVLRVRTYKQLGVKSFLKKGFA